ncbi:protein containing Sua5/YciO/YrdC, partial [gut metagenome]
MNINTELLKADSASIQKAAELLKNGSIVAIPTETVYGIAASAF